MHSYKLPPAAFEHQPSPPPARQAASPPGGVVPGKTGIPARRPALFRSLPVPGLLRLLLRAAAARTAASGRLIDEQEERQLRLLRRCSPASGAGR